MDVEWAGDNDTTTDGRARNDESSTISSHLRHDIRGAATTIVWLASALGTGSLGRGERERAVLNIVECAHMILELAHDDADRPSELAALSDIVHSVASRARMTHPVDVLVVDETVEAFPTSRALDMARVMDNLVTNACNAAGTGGTVVINLAEHRDSIEIEIVDSGPGFDADRPAGGLGLAIVATLVERLGGEFAVANLGDRRGTSARVVLPRPAPVHIPHTGKSPT